MCLKWSTPKTTIEIGRRGYSHRVRAESWIITGCDGMKGVVIFDERANLAFYTVDKELEEYVFGRMQELEEEAGATVRSFTLSVW